METKADHLSRCTAVLREEVALLAQFSKAQETVRDAVFAREWTGLEKMLVALDQQGEEFSRLEEQRMTLFAQAGGEGSSGFYALASRLDPVERRELTDLYRELKMAILKVRLANDSLSHYLSEARTTITGFLEAAFPDRKGRLYSRKGKAVHSEMRSIVLDHCL